MMGTVTDAAMRVAQVLLPIAVTRATTREQLFDYRLPELPEAITLAVGDIVEVPFGKRQLLGVVVGFLEESEVPTKKLRTLQFLPTVYPRLSGKLLQLLDFTAHYYQQPRGLVYALALPPRLESAQRSIMAGFRLTLAGQAAEQTLSPRAPIQQALWRALQRVGTIGLSRLEIEQIGKTALAIVRTWCQQGWVEGIMGASRDAATPQATSQDEMSLNTASQKTLVLNDAQTKAVEAVQAAWGNFARFLLHGVTGSGKTEVYAQLIAEALRRQQQVLLLVPEINLTPKILQRFRQQFPHARVEALHSNIAAGWRRSISYDAALGKVDLLIGTRLAVFASLAKLGLILVDEEHDASYKQAEGIRYSARDLAIYRAQLENIPVLLGSATPSLETYWQGTQGRYQVLQLPDRAISGARLVHPSFIPAPVDLAADGLAEPLLEAIASNLQQQRQVLIFVNRRGYAPSLYCRSCSWAARCHQCSARLTVHLGQKCLRCHHCGSQTPIYPACPDCGNLDLLPLGIGTERVAGKLANLFPQARIARIDRDTMMRKAAWEKTLAAIENGEIDLLVGTQMLAKGHHFPRLGLVGILGADQALYSADFRATERAYALLLQVAGRVGRAEYSGQIMIQTDFPQHPLYLALQDGSLEAFADFAQNVLRERQQATLPPYSFLVVWRAEAKHLEAVQQSAERAHRLAQQILAEQALAVECYPPLTPALERKANWHRRQMLLQSSHRASMQHFLGLWRQALSRLTEPGVRWLLDVDPLEVE